jgi:hypothetical protein
MSLGPTDPEEIIDFLLKETPEPFPFARLIALLTLCAWMRWPDDEDDVVFDAQTTAAAAIFLHEQQAGNTLPLPITIERLCDSVVNRRLQVQYYEAFQEEPLLSIADIVGFFMHCPEERRPSLGKAYHFIESGGFLPVDFDEKTRKRMKRARSSLKAAWKAQARSGPLLWATYLFEEDPELAYYAPDDIECFEHAISFLENRERLLNFFGVALFCQLKLSRLLPQQPQVGKISFVSFPTVVKPVDPQIYTFDENQLKILSKYVAPQ